MSVPGPVLLLLDDRRLAERLRLALLRLEISAQCGDPAKPPAEQVARTQPSLLLMDAQLPSGRSGLEVAAALRQHHPGLPVVLYGGNGGALLRPALHAGIRDVIAPQADPAGEILAVIQRELLQPAALAPTAEAQITAMAGMLGAGLLLWGTDGRLSQVNPLAAQQLGWKVEGLLGRELQAIYSPPAFQRAGSPFNATGILHPANSASVDGASLRKSDGTELLIEGLMLPVRTDTMDGDSLLLFRPAFPGGTAFRLREDESLIRQLLDQSPDPVLRTDSDGRIIFANDSAARLLGWEGAQLLHVLFNDLVAQENERAPGMLRLSQVMRAALGSPTELAMRHRDGTVRYVAWTFHAVPAHDGHPGGGLAAGRDTTLRRLVERELAESENRYRRLLDAALDGILVLSAEHGIVLDANPAMLTLLGIGREALVGQPLWEISAFSAAFNDPAAIRRLASPSVTNREELPLNTGGGEIRIVEFVSQCYEDDGEQLIRCNVRDISSLKREMAISQRQAERLRLVNQIALMVNERLQLDRTLALIVEEIQRQLKAGMVAVLRRNPDGESLRVLAAGGGENWNPVPFGLAPGMVLDVRDNRLLQATNSAQLMQLAPAASALEAALVQSGCVAAGASPLRVEGSELGILLIALGEGEAAGEEALQFLAQIANHVAVAIRNAELYQELQDACALLRDSQQQVVAQERLRALGTMASGIAHDLNNALAPVIGFTELLLEDPAGFADRAQTRHYLELIRTGATDGAAVVARLRDFYRHRQTGEVLAELDLNEVVRSSVELTAPRWKNIAMANGVKIDVRSELCSEPRICGSEAELRELLANLIINAADAMPMGGEICLVTEKLADNRVSLEIRDTGTGMTAEVRARCLEPFFSTKGAQGTGLGLAMAYGITQRHGALLEIESLSGHGTSIAAIFPPFQQSAPASSQPAPDAPIIALRILVADDDAAMRELLSAYLRADGHAVTLAKDGEEAYTLCRPGHFDLVISDRAMPRMSGLKLAEELRRQPGAPPLLMLSGFRDSGEGSALPPGVDAQLTKPVTRRRLRQAIAQLTPAHFTTDAVAGQQNDGTTRHELR